MADKVNHPEHYNSGNIECIDAMVSAFGTKATIIFCVENAFKYLWRCRKKGGIEDLKKAAWYIEKALELATSNGDSTPLDGCFD